MLRQRREVMERLGNEIQREVDTIRRGNSQEEGWEDDSFPPEDDGDGFPPSVLLPPTDSSEEEEQERGTAGSREATPQGDSNLNSDGFRRSSSSRIPIRESRRSLLSGRILMNLNREEIREELRDREERRRERRSSRLNYGPDEDSWRPLTIRQHIRAGLRREAERDRVRLARERDLSLRRMRMREELSTQGTDRFPPLRELILRRLRGRNGGGAEAEEEELLPPSTGTETESRDRSRHREMLSWMVDQLTIDHEGEAEQLDSINIAGPSGVGGGAGAAAQPPVAGPSVGAVGDRLPPRLPRRMERTRPLRGGGEEDRRREDLPPFARERRMYRDYHFLHQNGPSNIALTHR